MRIISKFKDYYDSVQLYGVDNRTTFIRKTSDPIHVDKLDIFNSDFSLPGKNSFGESYCSYKDRRKPLIAYDYLFLFFCGTVFPIIVYQELSKDMYYDKLKYCYDIETVENLMVRHNIEKYFEKNRYTSWRIDLRKQSKVKELFNAPIDKNKVLELHHKLESPYFVFSTNKSSITVNPVLKDLWFFKIVDSFKTYQEVYMFISGILGGKSPKTVEVSDEIRKSKHGFDKWSFKTMPK